MKWLLRWRTNRLKFRLADLAHRSQLLWSIANQSKCSYYIDRAIDAESQWHALTEKLRQLTEQ